MESDKERLVLNTVGWKRVKHFPGRAVKALGIAQVVFGCLAIAAQIVILAIYNIFFNAISQGVWCGLAFIFCGAFGIVAGKRRTLPWVIAHLVFCIVVCIFCACIMGLSALNAAYAYGSPYHYVYPCYGNTGGYTGGYNYGSGNYYSGTGGYNYGSGNYYSGNYYGGSEDYWSSYYSTGNYMAPSEPCYGRYVLDVFWVVQFSMNLLMILLGLVNTVVVIIGATLSCAPLCCNPEEAEADTQETARKQLLSGGAAGDQMQTLADPDPAPAYVEHLKLDVPTDAMHI